MTKIFFVLPVFVMFITIGCLAQNKTIELKFNLPVGAGYDYAAEMNIATKGNANGQEVNVNNTIAFGYHFGVTGDSAGWKKLSSTIARIALSINVAGMNINYDSDKPEDTSDFIGSMMGKILGAMKGGQFTFTMNEKGEIGSVTGINELKDKMASSAAESGATGEEGISNVFNEESFKQNIQQAFGVYPGKPVKPGDAWTSVMTTNNANAKLKIDNVYTLESVSGNIAHVKVNSTISSLDNSDSSSNGTMTGFMNYDIPTGVAVNGELDMKLNDSATQLTSDVKMKITGRKS